MCTNVRQCTSRLARKLRDREWYLVFATAYNGGVESGELLVLLKGVSQGVQSVHDEGIQIACELKGALLPCTEISLFHDPQ